MTLPKPCPKPDCKAPIAHRHASYGALYACHFVLNGQPCPHDDTDIPCYAPRVTASPLHLPDVDTVARKIHDAHWPTIDWDAERDDVKDECRAAARAVLDLIAARVRHWQPVEPIDIKVGDRVRLVTAQGDESIYTVTWRDQDWINGHDETRDVRFPHTWYIDPATVPAPTLTERIRAALNDSPESTISLDVADVRVLLDMVGGEQS